MLLYVNVDTQTLIEGPGFNNPVNLITIPRSDAAPISVMFVRNNSVYDPETTVATITSTSTTTGSAQCTVITSTPHGFEDGDTVKIRNVNGEVPSINGNYVITYVDDDEFTIPVPAPQTVAGTGGTATRVDPPLDLRWTVKAVGRFDQNPPMAEIAAGDFHKYGSGTTTVFRGQCNYFTDLINDALGVDAIPGNDNPQVDMMAELSWTGGEPGKINWINHSVRNDIYKVGDTAPVITP